MQGIVKGWGVDFKEKKEDPKTRNALALRQRKYCAAENETVLQVRKERRK
jgi:hypothetical protein